MDVILVVSTVVVIVIITSAPTVAVVVVYLIGLVEGNIMHSIRALTRIKLKGGRAARTGKLIEL